MTAPVDNPKNFPMGHVFNRGAVRDAIDAYLDLKPLAGAYRKKVRARLDHLRRPYMSLLDRIAGKPSPHLQGKALNSHAGRVFALMRAYTKRGRYMPLSLIEKQAKRVDCYVATTERVRVEWRIPVGGKPRPICKSGVFRTAKGLILRDVLLASGVESEIDYSRRGAGGEKAYIGAISEKMASGYEFWVTPDVTNFYLSLHLGHFEELPISENLIRNVAFLNEEAKITVILSSSTIRKVRETLIRTYGDKTLSFPMDTLVLSMTTTLLRQGLCLGSVLSPLLAQWFLDQAAKEAGIGSHVFVGSIVDDLALGSVKKAEVANALAALSDSLAHPAGTVVLHDTEIRSKINKWVLVYVLQPGNGYRNNPVHVKPGRKRTDRMKARLASKLTKADKSGHDLMDVADQYESRWYPSMQAWTKVPGHSRQLSQNIVLSYVTDFIDGIPMGTTQFGKKGGSAKSNP